MTEEDRFKAIRLSLLSVFSGQYEVVRAFDNRVPAPKGPYIMMSDVATMPIGRPVSEVGDNSTTIKSAKEYTVGLDFFGKDAESAARQIADIWLTAEWLEIMLQQNTNVIPLYADREQKLPIINGEQQYESRWHLDVTLQVNNEYILATQSASVLEFDVEEVMTEAVFTVMEPEQ